MAAENITGRCDCGAVQYSGASASNVTLCFCKQCQRHNAYSVASSKVPLEGFAITDPAGVLKWFGSSSFAKRGFCGTCGSALFWQMFDENGEHAREHISVMAGSIDDTSALELEDQIFTDEVQAYHHIDYDKPNLTEQQVMATPNSY